MVIVFRPYGGLEVIKNRISSRSERGHLMPVFCTIYVNVVNRLCYISQKKVKKNKREISAWHTILAQDDNDDDEMTITLMMTTITIIIVIIVICNT